MKLTSLALAALLAAPVSLSQTFLVTVVTKTAEHPYQGQGNAEGYAIDGEEGAELTLVRGQTYTFRMNGVPPSHPFTISTSAVGGGVGTWTDGVTGSGATGNQTLTFTVPASAPDQLWYQCNTHQRMGWRIDVVAATDTEEGGEGYGLTLETENPARGVVRFALTIPTAQDVRAEVFAADGRRVAVLLDGPVPGSAVYRLSFDG